MDSHITGPRGKQVLGAVLSAVAAVIKFGDAAQTGKELFRTQGATPAQPLFVRITGVIATAFDATGVAAKITMFNLDGSNPVDVATLAALSKTLLLTDDKIFKVIYTVGTGGTAGQAGYLCEAVGVGFPQT
jgi:hypothetical protein